jgi:hypothetical protein
MIANCTATTAAERTIFLTWVGAEEQASNARLLISSLRAFGGPWHDCPVWAFLPDSSRADWAAELENVRCLPLGEHPLRYYFASKVRACSLAEEMAGSQVRSLVWLDPSCLIVQPPELLDLGAESDAAFRPVHIRNVGTLAGEPLEPFWGEVYRAVGLQEASFTVESFVDRQVLRPYFNTHLFAVNPALGILRRWWRLFQAMADDKPFQTGPCADELHRIFLHQAVLSALLAKEVPRERLRLLPPEYSYPLHLHQRVPPERQVRTLNELVCPVYEDVYRHPETLNGLPVREPLDSWLGRRF